MDKRQYCFDFLESECKLEGNCPFAHIIVEDKEEFYKTNTRSTFGNTDFLNNNNPNDFNTKTVIPGKSLVICKCQACQKGISYKSTVVSDSDIQSKLCKDCITSFKSNPEKFQKEYSFFNDENSSFMYNML